jgi:hypothetical protein
MPPAARVEITGMVWIDIAKRADVDVEVIPIFEKCQNVISIQSSVVGSFDLEQIVRSLVPAADMPVKSDARIRERVGTCHRTCSAQDAIFTASSISPTSHVTRFASPHPQHPPTCRKTALAYLGPTAAINDSNVPGKYETFW